MALYNFRFRFTFITWRSVISHQFTLMQARPATFCLTSKTIRNRFKKSLKTESQKRNLSVLCMQFKSSPLSLTKIARETGRTRGGGGVCARMKSHRRQPTDCQTHCGRSSDWRPVDIDDRHGRRSLHTRLAADIR